MPNSPLLKTSINSLTLLHQGKVRDMYDIDDHHLLMVSTDRLSAFDVILPTGIENKGAMLTQMASFWFEKLKHVVPNHLTGISPESVLSEEENTQFKHQLHRRAVVVKKLKPLPVEAIVRGYIAGSGWKEYLATGTVCGIALPKELQQAEMLPMPLFTPSSKAEVGDHDENINFQHCIDLIGKDLTNQIAKVSIQLYKEAAEYALTKGIIIADTKFEFGLDENGRLTLIDEILSPDSSRFWPASEYQVGTSPPSFDKQFIRDYLETLDWDKTPPGPHIPPEILAKSAEKYQEVASLLLS